jgi:hypothetical protein
MSSKVGLRSLSPTYVASGRFTAHCSRLWRPLTEVAPWRPHHPFQVRSAGGSNYLGLTDRTAAGVIEQPRRFRAEKLNRGRRSNSIVGGSAPAAWRVARFCHLSLGTGTRGGHVRESGLARNSSPRNALARRLEGRAASRLSRLRALPNMGGSPFKRRSSVRPT